MILREKKTQKLKITYKKLKISVKTMKRKIKDYKIQTYKWEKEYLTRKCRRWRSLKTNRKTLEAVYKFLWKFRNSMFQRKEKKKEQIKIAAQNFSNDLNFENVFHEVRKAALKHQGPRRALCFRFFIHWSSRYSSSYQEEAWSDKRAVGRRGGSKKA